MDSDTYAHLTGQLNGLVIRVEGRLPELDLGLVGELIEVGEFGVALELLADLLVEEGLSMPLDERVDVLKLARVMGMETLLPGGSPTSRLPAGLPAEGGRRPPAGRP